MIETVAALCVKATSDLLVRFFLAMLDAWRRSEVKVLLRDDQEATVTLILREVQARRRQNALLKRSPVKKPRNRGRHGTCQSNSGRDTAHRETRYTDWSWWQAGHGSPLISWNDMNVKNTVRWRCDVQALFVQDGQSEQGTRCEGTSGSNEVERCSWSQERRRRSVRGRDRDQGLNVG